MDKNLDYYLSLPYTREIIPDPSGCWFVRIKELPGCMSQGETAQEALRMIEDALQLWLKISLEDGDSIPEPKPEEEYSGKFVVRVPKSLHRQLVETAEQEGVSLNQYVSAALAMAVGGQCNKQPESDLIEISRSYQILQTSIATGQQLEMLEARQVAEGLANYMHSKRAGPDNSPDKTGKKTRHPAI